ncbi:hypothetical protein LIER_27684 [Lithospermum erythrorhizon]|uniref:MULE transposase domain-containing protein n=1 Tax=Lithospermum erythrorhizon TaxID=34254 RepID=A0AAV3REL5_LITER
MVCMEESFDTWSYFLEALTNYLGHDHHFRITFTSDRQKGLINAVKEKCPNSPQRHCARHLYANFRKKYPGVRLRQLFWKAVKSYNKWDFDDYMKGIKLVDLDAYKWLTNDCGAAIDTWARHKFDEAGISDHVTNNMCESFNAYLANPRKQPILTLLEFIRKKITKRFCTRYKKACNWSSPLPPKVMKRINQRYQEGRNLLAISTNEWTFQVEGDKRSYIVNLREKQCEYREWLLTGIPSPVQDKCMWREVESQWQPPKQSKKRGRQKMSRRKEQWEIGGSTSKTTPLDKIDQPRSSHGRCGFCKELGHNRLTCPHISNEERVRKKATRKTKSKCAPSSSTHD